MADGFVASQEGIDVNDALDSQKVADSRWKYFDILTEVPVNLPETTGTFTRKTWRLYRHGLGYLPAFDVYHIAKKTYLPSSVPDTAAPSQCVADNEWIMYIDDSGTDYYGDCLLRIYSVDITQEYAAPVELTFAKSTSKPSRFGLKATDNAGLNAMGQDELSYYGANTNSKTLAVQKTGTVRADANTNFRAIIEHNLGAPPNYLAAPVKKDNSYIGALNPNFIPVIADANAYSLIFRGAQSALIGNFAYVIFKEFADLAV